MPTVATTSIVGRLGLALGRPHSSRAAAVQASAAITAGFLKDQSPELIDDLPATSEWEQLVPSPLTKGRRSVRKPAANAGEPCLFSVSWTLPQCMYLVQATPAAVQFLIDLLVEMLLPG